MDGSLDPGSDGFGIGPKRIPYCETCFPQNGSNYTYAIRFPILRTREPIKEKSSEFVWDGQVLGNRGPRLLTE